MPDDPLQNAIWHALETSHRELALSAGRARRYPAAIAPFAAVHDCTPEAMADLCTLLDPGESVFLLGRRPPAAPGLRWDGVVPCLQMVFPETAPLPPVPADLHMQPLDCTHAREMMALIQVAFPGYFRPQTCRMGLYLGIRDGKGRLIAMGGERLILAPPRHSPWHEISGLCSHPSYAGRGLGTALLTHLLAVHRAARQISWLHVAESNRRAIDLYRRLGFHTLRTVSLHRMLLED